jgi:hypothetical protein
LFAFLGYLPIVGAVGFLTFRIFHTDVLAFVAAFAWMAFCVVAGIRLSRFECPRCGKLFFSKWWYHNQFALKCVHCRLPKYALQDKFEP